MSTVVSRKVFLSLLLLRSLPAGAGVVPYAANRNLDLTVAWFVC